MQTPVRTLAFDFENVFKAYINAPLVVQNNPPGTAPNVPSFSMTDGMRTMTAADNTVFLDLRFDSGLPKGESLTNVLEKPIELMDELDKLLPGIKKQFSAIILTISLPYAGDQAEVGAYLSDIAFKFPVKDVISTTFSVAKKRNEFIHFVEFSQFKFFEIIQQFQPGVFFGFDPDFTDAKEEGLQLKIDVNTRPLIDSPKRDEFKSLGVELADAVSNDVDLYAPGFLKAHAPGLA